MENIKCWNTIDYKWEVDINQYYNWSDNVSQFKLIFYINLLLSLLVQCIVENFRKNITYKTIIIIYFL